MKCKERHGQEHSPTHRKGKLILLVCEISRLPNRSYVVVSPTLPFVGESLHGVWRPQDASITGAVRHASSMTESMLETLLAGLAKFYFTNPLGLQNLSCRQTTGRMRI